MLEKLIDQGINVDIRKYLNRDENKANICLYKVIWYRDINKQGHAYLSPVTFSRDRDFKCKYCNGYEKSCKTYISQLEK